MKKKKKLEDRDCNATDETLKLMVSGLNPDLAKEVRKYWKEPDSFTRHKLLGHGAYLKYNDNWRSLQ